MSTNEKIKCFVIMPISDQPGYDSGHFDLVYEDIIQPAIIEAGMQPIRADETKATNLIQLDILKKVINSPIAICDISAKNPNVFYELGMRQAFDMPTVLLKDDITDAPFDISVLRYCSYKKAMRHREVLQAIDSLKKMLTETYKNKEKKAEINSLIRLLELSSPAKISNDDLSGQEREEKLTAIKIDSLLKSVEGINSKLNEINFDSTLSDKARKPVSRTLLEERNRLRATAHVTEANTNVYVK